MSHFIHLHLHTEYAVVDGLVRINALIDAAAENGMPAVAITDEMNTFAAVKFYQQALAAGIQPIIGADLNVVAHLDHEHCFKLTVLCQNQTGYRNLSELLSMAYQHGQKSGVPRIAQDWFDQRGEGLIALSGGVHGNMGEALLNHQHDMALASLNQWTRVFPGRFYIELQRLGRPFDDEYNQAAVKLAHENNVPVVATNDVRFISQDDFEAHEARVCIQTGRVLHDKSRPKPYRQAQYLRSSNEMSALFRDIPQAIENTRAIAKRCYFQLPLDTYYLPEFPIPEGQDKAGFLKAQAEAGLEVRLDRMMDPNDPERALKRRPYDERLTHELEVINSMGFPGYFLIVADFIRWAREQAIPVGPGRGSGAGSLVAYALGITNLDPIDLGLLFERFLNPERVSMPDFDVDFCMDHRDRVIEYVAEQYGRSNVSQIITYGTMAARAVVRDVGRILGHPYGYVDKIAKLIPFELGMTLNKALESPDLKQRYDEEEDVATLLNLAMKLEGITRNAGKHAGGVVIAPRPLTHFMPLYCEPDGEGIVSQFDKDDVEAIGLVKFDFLGLRTLTIINWACQKVNATRQRQGQPPIDIEQLPLNDEATFQLLCQCETTAVFQLESRGMKDLIRRLQPDHFGDIIALVALFRPGPLQSGMVEDFIDRKHGRAETHYPHPWLEPILEPTYGVILYQEQVMQIAQVLAGYTLGSADILRRAMGKKKQKEMAKQRSVFIEGAKERGIDEATSDYIFNLIEKFAGYGFNKSHSAAYALLAYQTAWLKAHYPAEFMAAVLSSDMDNTDKVVIFVEECWRMGLEILRPDINQSGHHFTVNDQGAIIYGLGAIKGVGETAIESILEERQKKGAYRDLFDLCQRVDLRKLNRRVLEALISAGALDCFGVHRARLMANVDKALKQAEQSKANQALGQGDLFGDASIAEDSTEQQYTHCSPWPEQARLNHEKAVLGFYLTGHPFNSYQEELTGYGLTPLTDIANHLNQSISVAGIIEQVRVINTKRGDRMAIVQISDSETQVEAVVFSDLYQDKRPMLMNDRLVIVEAEVSQDAYRGGHKLIVQKITDIVTYRQRRLKAVQIQYPLSERDICHRLKAILEAHPGNCPVWVRYEHPEATALVVLGSQWRVEPVDELLHGLGVLGCKPFFR